MICNVVILKKKKRETESTKISKQSTNRQNQIHSKDVIYILYFMLVYIVLTMFVCFYIRYSITLTE